MIDSLYGVKCLKLGFDRYSKIGTNMHYVFFDDNGDTYIAADDLF